MPGNGKRRSEIAAHVGAWRESTTVTAHSDYLHSDYLHSDYLLPGLLLDKAGEEPPVLVEEELLAVATHSGGGEEGGVGRGRASSEASRGERGGGEREWWTKKQKVKLPNFSADDRRLFSLTPFASALEPFARPFVCGCTHPGSSAARPTHPEW